VCGLGHADLLFGLASEARGLAGEGYVLARPRRVIWSGQVRGDEVARQIFQNIQGGFLKDFRP
jgi:hypothetical protein